MRNPIHQHMATLMISFLAGLFVGAGKFEEIKDNLDLERWFRLPKSHERRIHGRRHAGIRIVQDGPTLVLALDAHVGASRAIYRRRFAAVSHSPRTTLPTGGAEPTQDYEESTLEEEATDSLG